MNWLRKFVLGRYGVDQLSLFLLMLSVIINWVAKAADLPILVFAGYIPLGLCLYRILSKDTAKRSMENYKFSLFIRPVFLWFKKTQRHIKEYKTHSFFKCPNCKSDLRLPKGKGKIIITCPKCKTEFSKRT